jgi:hypothetical protein
MDLRENLRMRRRAREDFSKVTVPMTVVYNAGVIFTAYIGLFIDLLKLFRRNNA